MKRLTLILALCLAANAAQAQKITATPHGDYQGVTFEMTSGGSLTVAAGLHQINGKVAVCGFVWFENATGTTRNIEHLMTRKVQYVLDGRVLGVTPQSFVRLDSVEEAKTSKAGCSVLRKDWSDVKDPKSFHMTFPKRASTYG